MTESLHHSSAPVFKVDGELRGELARDVLRLDVHDTTAGLRTLSARFVAVGPRPKAPVEQSLYLDGTVIDFGRRIEVSIGPPGVERVIFSGRISGLEATFAANRPPAVAVFAEDDLMALRMTRRTRTYTGVSDADIARALASEHGLSAEVDADGPTYDVVQQLDQSDLAFLRERAARVGAELWCADGKLGFQTRDRRSATTVTLVEGNDLSAVELRADLAHQRSAVQVTGYDAAARDAIDEEAGADAVQAEVTSGRTGPAVLNSALGERTAQLARSVPLTSGEAAAWARTEMLRRSRGFVRVQGVTRGTPDLMVGSRMRLERVGTPFEGDGYYATLVHHSFTVGRDAGQRGHQTRFEAERASLNGGGA